MHSHLPYRIAFVAFSALLALMPVSVNAATTTVPIRLHDMEPPVVIVRVQGRDLPLQLDLLARVCSRRARFVWTIRERDSRFLCLAN
jgi:hypothetical protein